MSKWNAFKKGSEQSRGHAHSSCWILAETSVYVQEARLFDIELEELSQSIRYWSQKSDTPPELAAFLTRLVDDIWSRLEPLTGEVERKQWLSNRKENVNRSKQSFMLTCLKRFSEPPNRQKPAVSAGEAQPGQQKACAHPVKSDFSVHAERYFTEQSPARIGSND